MNDSQKENNPVISEYLESILTLLDGVLIFDKNVGKTRTYIEENDDKNRL